MAFNEVWGMRADRQGKPFYRMATDDGTPGGVYEMTGNHLTTPKDFWVEAPPGINYFGMAVSLFLTLTNLRDKNAYGEILMGLTNGINLIYKRGDEEFILNPNGPIKTNSNLVTAGWRPYFSNLNGNEDLFIFEYFFLERFGNPQVLYGDVGDKFIVRVNDDFTSLTTHCLAISGLRQEA